MSLPPQKLREIVFLILYAKDFTSPAEELIPLIMHELKVSNKHVQEAFVIADEIGQYKTQIDQMIGKASDAYELHRIQTVEKNVLRLAVYELLIKKELPQKVVIAEAKRLTKKFSTKEAQVFVYALLETLLR